MKGYEVRASSGGIYGVRDDYKEAMALLKVSRQHDPGAELREYEYESLGEKCKRLEDELEAVLRDVPHDCEHCKTGDCYIRNGTEHCHWQWRGAQEGGNHETDPV